MRLRLSYLALLSMAVTNSVSATSVYYVSNSGNDVADGLTPQTAWASLAKVNAASAAFTPGTQVLLERGGVWRESLNPQSSGTVALPITFSAYGNASLERPTLLGSDPISGFTSYSASTYVTNTSSIGTNNLGAVYLNHEFLHAGAVVDPSDPLGYVQATENSYYFDPGAGKLYVNPGTTAMNSAMVTATRRPDIVRASEVSNLVFDNLRTDETAQFNSGYGFYLDRTHNVVIQNSEAYRAAKHHFGVINSFDFVGKNLRAAYTLPDQESFGGASAYVSYADDQAGAGSTTLWEDITAENMGKGYAMITHGPGIDKAIIKNMHAPGANSELGTEGSGQVKLTGGTVGPLLLRNNVVVEGTTNTEAIYFFGSNSVVKNASLLNFSPSPEGFSGGVIVFGFGNRIEDSVIDFADEATGSLAKFVIVQGSGGITSLNNLFEGPGAYIRVLSGYSPLFNSDYNHFTTAPYVLYRDSMWMTSDQWLATHDFNSTVGPIPEPASLALLAFGLGALMVRRRR